MPTTLQPGTGESSVFLGLFFTRVNQQYERFGRIAYHTGATYTFRFEEDGIDPGDQLVLFTSVVKPVIRDLLSLDLSFVTGTSNNSIFGKASCVNAERKHTASCLCGNY